MSLVGFAVGTFAAVCFYAAALAPLAERRRAGVAAVGVVADWIPLFAGWMAIPGDPPALLYAVHMGFGFVGYLLLVYCFLGWIRGVQRRLAVRVAFLAVWTPAYLAGVVMAAQAGSISL